MAIGGLIGAGLGSVLGQGIGAYGQSRDISRGMEEYKGLANQGINVLNQGKAGSDAAFNPYTTAGQTGVQGQTAAVQGYMGAVDPSQYKSSAQGTQAWLDPSAAYSTDQANRAMQASALAKGGVGGGLAKALSNSANKMAMTNWNNAAQQQFQANNQNFSQNKSAQDANVGNWSNLAQQGLQATGQNQNIQAGYNSGINSNFLDQAAAMQSGWNAKGKVFGDAVSGIGNTVGKVFGGLF